MLLKLYDLEHTLIGGLKNHKDAKVESELSSGDKTLSFLWHSRNKLKVSNEYYIRTDTDEFVVKENSKGTNGYRKITAKLNLEDIEAKVWRTFTASESTAQEMADLALANTGWTCVSTVPEEKLRNVTMVKVNSYQIFEKIQEAFICEVQWDTLNKIVYLKEKVGQDRGAYFISGLNLKELSDSSDTYDFATEIIPFGADDLDITSVNNGSNYLSNYQYSNKKITVIWEDSNYTDPQALLEDAEYRLNEISKPKKTQQAKIIDLAKLKPEYEILAYSVGDTVTLIDDETGIREKQRITKTVEYLESPEKNTCDISNTVLSFEEMQKKLFAAADCVSNITTSNGTVKGSSVDKIDISQIIGIEEYLAGDLKDFKADYIYARKELGAVYAAIGEADLTTVNTNNLTVNIRADIELAYITKSYTTNAYGDYAKFKVVEAENISALAARVDEFFSTEITTEYLEANYTKTKDLESNYAAIDLANVKVESVQDLFVNVGLIKDATIVDGHITGYLDAVSINAESIKAGTLSIDRLVLNGTEDSLIFALNNIGELTSTHCDTLDGGLITERTITAEHIVTGAITANEIASETITADKINVADLFAQDITATGSITGAKLYGSYIETASGKIGGFDIGSTYLANNTTALKTTANSVYVGTDGISCGTKFKVGSDGIAYLEEANIYGNIYVKEALYLEDPNVILPSGATGYVSKMVKALYCESDSNLVMPNTGAFQAVGGITTVVTDNCFYSGQNIYAIDGIYGTKIYGGTIYENGTALSSKYQAKYSYTTTAQHSTGYYKIKINATNAWMLSFVINVYQDYKATSIMVSGYNYGENYWYSPSSVMLGQTTYDTMNVIFGYDSAWNLWVAIPAANYTGISITNVVNGYQAVTMDGLFSISYVTSLSTIQTTIPTTSGTATLQGIHPSASATGNTVAVRHSGGYLFATYFNQSSSVETPTTSSYIMYANSDGYLRKSSLASIKSILGLGSAAYTASTAYAVASHNHDDRYYLKDEITKKFNTLKNELIGGSYTSHIQLGSTGTGTKYVRVFNDNNTVDLRAMTHAGVYHSTASGYGTEGWLIYINTAGAIKTNTTSDKRLKNYISDLSEKEASYLLQEINPILFTYKGVAKEASLDVSCGFYAQEIRDVLVKHDIGYRSYLLIHDNNSDEDIYDLKTDEESVTYGLDYSKLTPVLWKGWQMHQERLEVLEKRVKSLETENVELKQKIETLAT